MSSNRLSMRSSTMAVFTVGPPAPDIIAFAASYCASDTSLIARSFPSSLFMTCTSMDVASALSFSSSSSACVAASSAKRPLSLAAWFASATALSSSGSFERFVGTTSGGARTGDRITVFVGIASRIPTRSIARCAFFSTGGSHLDAANRPAARIPSRACLRATPFKRSAGPSTFGA